MNALSRWWQSKSTGFKLFVGAFALTAGILVLGAFGITGASGILNGLGGFLADSFNGLVNFSNSIGNGINGLFNNPLSANGSKFVGAMVTTGASLLVADGIRRGAAGLAGRQGFSGRRGKESDGVELQRAQEQTLSTEMVTQQKQEKEAENAKFTNVQSEQGAGSFVDKYSVRSNNNEVAVR